MLIRRVFKPVIKRSLAKAIENILKRFFITTDLTLNPSFTLENTWTATGDFLAGAEVILPTAATTFTILGQSASAANFFQILSTGFASINIGGLQVTSTVATTKDNKFRRYDVELLGDDFKFMEEGVVIDTVTDAVAAANSFVIDALAVSNGALFFDNVFANPKLQDNSTSSNTFNWRIKEPTGNTEQALEGSNLLTYNNIPTNVPDREEFTFIDGDWIGLELAPQLLAGWDTVNAAVTQPSTGSYNIDYTGAFAIMLQEMNILEITQIYSWSLNSKVTSGNMAFFIGNSGVQNITSSQDSYSGIDQPVSDGRIQFAEDTFNGVISSVSVKRILELP